MKRNEVPSPENINNNNKKKKAIDLTGPSPPAGQQTPVRQAAAASAAARSAISPRNLIDLTDDSPSPRVTPAQVAAATAATSSNLQDILGINDKDDEEDPLPSDITNIRGRRETLVYLVKNHHLDVTTYHPFRISEPQLFDEIQRLIEDGFFDDSHGIGALDPKRGPVFMNGNQSPHPVKISLQRLKCTVILGYVKFWEDICKRKGMVLVHVWITYYRERYDNDEEERRGCKLPFGVMVKHADSYPPGVVLRITTTMFEAMKNNKVMKRFSVDNEREGHADASFSAGNGTTVIMDSLGSGNTSQWKHSVKGAEGTYTITLQFARIVTEEETGEETEGETEGGGGEGRLKNPEDYNYNN